MGAVEPSPTEAAASGKFQTIGKIPEDILMNLNKSLRALTVGAAFLATSAMAQETVKVGVLHSLSGTMAISETSLRDVLLFTFDEVNKAGGVMGKMIEPVVVDG